MTVDQTVRGGIVFVEPKGRLTLETEEHLREVFRSLVDDGQIRIVLNLAGVPSMDSCGLGTIAQACVSTRRRGGDVKLVKVSDRNLVLLTVTKLLTVVEIYDSEEDAEGSFDITSQAPAEAGNPALVTGSAL